MAEVASTSAINPYYTDAMMKLLQEKLAALEHEQWTHWVKGMIKGLSPGEKLSRDRLKHWKILMDTPYEELPEKLKDMDRVWAYRVLQVLSEFRV